MAENSYMTTTELLAAASKILEDGDYRRIDLKSPDQWTTTNARLYEDDYSIVSIVVYETWADLSLNWMDMQGNFVELISKYMTSSDAKAWEGYLVLMTPSFVSPEAQAESTKIRYNTARVRKLLATGDELGTLADVERLLQPLLPLGPKLLLEAYESMLDQLPSLFTELDLPKEAVHVVIEAFRDRKSILESLHKYRRQI